MWHDGHVSRIDSKNRRLSLVALIASITIVIVSSACSPDGGSTTQGSSDITMSNIASPTDPLATSPPTSSADKDIPEEGEPQVEVVNILVDVAEGVVQEAAVPLGSPVNIRVRGSNTDEYHLHGYDLELEGTDVLFTFTADRLGDFELEAHNSGQQLLILTVFED